MERGTHGLYGRRVPALWLPVALSAGEYDDAVATARTRKKLTAAEQAHVAVLRQEARAERLLRQVEARANEIAATRDLMEGDHQLAPERLHNQADQWESLALREVNEGRPPWRICSALPDRCYEQKSCARYGQGR